MAALILILDADNTLWDADAVFTRAQLAMIEILEQQGHVFPTDKLTFLRHVDRALVERYGTFEYDFRTLSKALVCAVKNDQVECESSPLHPDTSSATAEAFQAFRQTLDASVPELLLGAGELIAWLRAERSCASRRVAAILLSEGDQRRLDRIAHHYGLDDSVFDHVHFLVTKDRESFAAAISEGRLVLGDPSALAVSIGDSLKRDVAPSKAAGCITVYKPHGFHGNEQPASAGEEPAHTVRTIHEALEIIERLLRNSVGSVQ